ncbi:hypothetical protein BRAS3843_1730016 [Bradyrhizobium sp. STM 3843]|uniref:hypothetical protein n=1 Tax=Bradyrhizobium sp. STM 3843 TaxID=551947 RepID=UPI0002407121|nr:hypothetical protein [Bradyrhizobium sp. STM 3843]CCE06447.1 hypothetical protein BRAS3843_1730016 [Bradyrhizobium sp. STM 3843]
MIDDNASNAVPSRQAVAAQDRSAPGQVTGRLRTAILAMVWEGARRAQAAEKAKMTDHSLRAALKKPHVLAFMNAELRVLRESERPKTIHRLTELRDQDRNANAAVAACKALEQISDAEAAKPGSNTLPQAPGLVVILNAGLPFAPQPPTIEHDAEVPRPLSPAPLGVTPRPPRRDR